MTTPAPLRRGTRPDTARQLAADQRTLDAARELLRLVDAVLTEHPSRTRARSLLADLGAAAVEAAAAMRHSGWSWAEHRAQAAQLIAASGATMRTASPVLRATREGATP